MADGSLGQPLTDIDDCQVRIAQPGEVDEVMRVALMGCEDNGFVPHNPVKVLHEVWAALNLAKGICGVIGPPGGRIEAGVLLRIGPVWYSDYEVLEEKAIFVDPTFRGGKGGRAAKLARFSIRVADGLGIPLCIGVLSAHRTAAKVKMYSRIFGEQSGAFWVYWPNGQAQPAES